MNKRKELKALLVENPWLKDHIRSLEAHIETLSHMNTSTNDECSSLEAEVEELEEAVTRQRRDLQAAHNDYASLNSRYQQLLKVVVAATKESKKEDY